VRLSQEADTNIPSIEYVTKCAVLPPQAATAQQDLR